MCRLSEFEDIAKNLNDILSCFVCAKMDRPPCSNCFKLPEKKVKIKDNNAGNTSDFPIKAPMSEKLKEKISKMLKKTSKDTSPCKIKQKPIIRKRKKINITMKELENDAEDDSDEDFVVTKKRR